jgi:hypothetical protein
MLSCHIITDWKVLLLIMKDASLVIPAAVVPKISWRKRKPLAHHRLKVKVKTRVKMTGLGRVVIDQKTSHHQVPVVRKKSSNIIQINQGRLRKSVQTISHRKVLSNSIHAKIEIDKGKRRIVLARKMWRVRSTTVVPAIVTMVEVKVRADHHPVLTKEFLLAVKKEVDLKARSRIARSIQSLKTSPANPRTIAREAWIAIEGIPILHLWRKDWNQRNMKRENPAIGEIAIDLVGVKIPVEVIKDELVMRRKRRKSTLSRSLNHPTPVSSNS